MEDLYLYTASAEVLQITKEIINSPKFRPFITTEIKRYEYCTIIKTNIKKIRDAVTLEIGRQIAESDDGDIYYFLCDKHGAIYASEGALDSSGNVIEKKREVLETQNFPSLAEFSDLVKQRGEEGVRRGRVLACYLDRAEKKKRKKEQEAWERKMRDKYGY